MSQDRAVVLTILVGGVISCASCSMSNSPTHYELSGDKVAFFQDSKPFDLNGWKTNYFPIYDDYGGLKEKQTEYEGPGNQYIVVSQTLDRSTGRFELSSVRYFVLNGPRGKGQKPKTVEDKEIPSKAVK